MFTTCPIWKKNILNLGQLLEKDCDIHVKDYNLFINDDKRILITKVKISNNRMFPLNIQNDITKYLMTCYKDISCLWHLRFEHLNFRELELLYKKNMVKVLPCITTLINIAKDDYEGRNSEKAFQNSQTSEQKSHSSSFM